jgi:hypothetical protein
MSASVTQVGYATINIASEQSTVPVVNPALNQDSAAFVTAAYFDVNNAAWTPTAVRWRLDDMTGGSVVQSWTGIVPAAVNNVTIAGTLNGMLSLTRSSEQRQFTVQITDSNAQVVYATALYQVLRVTGLT